MGSVNLCYYSYALSHVFKLKNNEKKIYFHKLGEMLPVLWALSSF